MIPPEKIDGMRNTFTDALAVLRRHNIAVTAAASSPDVVERVMARLVLVVLDPDFPEFAEGWAQDRMDEHAAAQVRAKVRAQLDAIDRRALRRLP